MTDKLADTDFFKTRQIEIDLRGSYLRFSANVEANLMRDLLLLNEQKFLQTGNEDPLNFKELMFHKKIEKLESLLKELQPDLFIHNVSLFQALYRFKDLRNKMAHCFFTWDKTDLNCVTIWEIEKGSDKIWHHVPVTYSINVLTEMLQKSMLEIIDEFNTLSQEIIKRLIPIMPYLIDQIPT